MSLRARRGKSGRTCGETHSACGLQVSARGTDLLKRVAFALCNKVVDVSSGHSPCNLLYVSRGNRRAPVEPVCALHECDGLAQISFGQTHQSRKGLGPNTRDPNKQNRQPKVSFLVLVLRYTFSVPSLNMHQGLVMHAGMFPSYSLVINGVQKGCQNKRTCTLAQAPPPTDVHTRRAQRSC